MPPIRDALLPIPSSRRIVQPGELEPLFERLVSPLDLLFRGHRPHAPESLALDRFRLWLRVGPARPGTQENPSSWTGSDDPSRKKLADHFPEPRPSSI